MQLGLLLGIMAVIAAANLIGSMSKGHQLYPSVECKSCIIRSKSLPGFE